MRNTIELFPQKQLITNFTQGTYDAVDTGNYQQGVLQIWVLNYSETGFSSSDSVTIFDGILDKN
ncbi:MAG: hypothetical protein AAFY41_11395, partial [Bacteroidota bacterium]